MPTATLPRSEVQRERAKILARFARDNHAAAALPNVPSGGNTTTRPWSPAGAAFKFFRVRQP